MDEPASIPSDDLVQVDQATLRAVTRQAAADAVPLFLPVVPFGFVIGVEIARSPIPNTIGLASSVLVFAGAAQLALVTLIGSAGVGAALITGIVLNARHVMYSAALAPAFGPQPRWFRWLGPLTLVDQVFAMSVPRLDQPPALFRRYYLVISSVFFPGWLAATALGLVSGGSIPDAWRLEFAPAVLFIGMVVLGLDRWPGAVAAIVGGGVCLAAIDLPNQSGLLVGAGAGIVAGAIADRSTTSGQSRDPGRPPHPTSGPDGASTGRSAT
jgi:predicted branched-subunit amino acid permease